MINYSIKINFLILGLFESVENNQEDQLQELLRKEDSISHINTLNNDGFSLLDVAVLLNFHAVIKTLLLLPCGAGFDVSGNIENHLNTLICESEQKLCQLVNASTSSSGPNGVLIDADKQKASYEKRIKLLKQMTKNWQTLETPSSPFSFSVGKCQASNVKNFLLNFIF